MSFGFSILPQQTTSRTRSENHATRPNSQLLAGLGRGLTRWHARSRASAPYGANAPAQYAASIAVKEHGPHRLVVRTSRRGRDNPGSTPGAVIVAMWPVAPWRGWGSMEILCHCRLRLEILKQA